jgi:PPM family protein phosphatase
MSCRPSPFTRLRVAARTDIGLRRHHNEDSFLVADLAAPVAEPAPLPPPRPAEGPARERWSFARDFKPEPPAPVAVTLESAVGVGLAVIDGMGGNCAGDIAARIAADTFAAALAVAPPSGEEACRRRVVGAMNDASRAVFEAVARGPRYYRGMGAAALIALVSGDRLHLAGAGDARAYILRLGRLVQVTRDDTLLNDRRALLDPDVSRIPACVITKALGLEEAVDVRAFTFELRAGDVILLCTDGLHRQVDDLAIERVLLELAEPAEAGLTLINLANRRGGADNIAVVVARPEGDDLRSPGSGDALENQNVP